MRDQHEGIRIAREVILQPVARFQIEVVGGLVQQQQVGLFEQQFGQRDAHLPAARELFRAPFPIALREAEAGEHCAHLRFHRVAVARVKLALGRVEAVGHLRVFGARGIELGHAARQLFLLFFQRPQVVEDRHAFGENGAAGKRKAVLRQIAEGRALLR